MCRSRPESSENGTLGRNAPSRWSNRHHLIWTRCALSCVCRDAELRCSENLGLWPCAVLMDLAAQI